MTATWWRHLGWPRRMLCLSPSTPGSPRQQARARAQELGSGARYATLCTRTHTQLRSEFRATPSIVSFATQVRFESPATAMASKPFCNEEVQLCVERRPDRFVALSCTDHATSPLLPFLARTRAHTTRKVSHLAAHKALKLALDRWSGYSVKSSFWNP